MLDKNTMFCFCDILIIRGDAVMRNGLKIILIFLGYWLAFSTILLASEIIILIFAIVMTFITNKLLETKDNAKNAELDSEIIKNEKTNNTSKKVLIGLLLAFPIFVIYGMLIVMLFTLVVKIITPETMENSYYGLVISMAVSPILTFITISKILSMIE